MIKEHLTSKTLTKTNSRPDAGDILKLLLNVEGVSALNTEEYSQQEKQEILKKLDIIEDRIIELKQEFASEKQSIIPRRSFWDGMASVLDIGARHYHRLASHYRVVSPKLLSLKSEDEAMRSDWRKVGQDIERAIRKYGEE